MIQASPLDEYSTPNNISTHQKTNKYDRVQLHFIDHTPHRLPSSLIWLPKNTPADICIYRRTKTVKKNVRQFFGMDPREIITGLQDDAEDGHYLGVCEIWNFDKKFYKLKSNVRTKSSIAKVHLTL